MTSNGKLYTTQRTHVHKAPQNISVVLLVASSLCLTLGLYGDTRWGSGDKQLKYSQMLYQTTKHCTALTQLHSHALHYTLLNYTVMHFIALQSTKLKCIDCTKLDYDECHNLPALQWMHNLQLLRPHLAVFSAVSTWDFSIVFIVVSNRAFHWIAHTYIELHQSHPSAKLCIYSII